MKARPPALIERMLNAKTEHDDGGLHSVALGGATLDEVLGLTYDMGNDDERKEVQAWGARQPDSFDSIAFTAKANAIAAIHRLTTEGGGTDEQ